MIERFEGEIGRRLFSDVMRRQIIIQGDDTSADQLMSSSQLEEYNTGEVLIAQQGDDNHIFFILSGSVVITVNGRVVAKREAGTHIGEMSLIDCKAPRCATATASEKTVVAKVTEEEFSRIASHNPGLWRRIAVELCDRLRHRNRIIRCPNERPRVFICSSVEGLGVAEQIQLGLEHHPFTVKLWTDQVFGAMKQTMEDLERELSMADFAVANVSGDDVATSRKKRSVVPRDNVIFELGLFMGQLGRDRTIMVLPRGTNLKLPSDLNGLNPLMYYPPSDPKSLTQLATSLGPVCTQLKAKLNELGPR